MNLARAGKKWRTLMVIVPLSLLVVIAIAAGGISASSAQYCEYGGCAPTHLAPASQYGISNQLLYVANGRASDVKVIDVGTMSIVDTIPIPNEVTPDFYNGLNTGLMNWELHGVIPAQDRSSVYAVGALSGGSYNRNPDGSIDTSSTAGDPLAGTPGFRLADYRLYEVSTSTKETLRALPLMGAGEPVNPVGYCGLEYNLNDESSNEVIAASMNAGNSTLASVLFLGTWQDTDPSAPRCYTTDPALVGTPCGVDLGPVAGRTGDVAQDGGWSFTDIATGDHLGFMSTDDNGDNESSTCGISWDATGTHAYASQMFEALVDTVDWTTRTTTGSIASYPGASYHQSASDKANGRLYVTSSAGTVDVFDMGTNLAIGQINIRALVGSGTSDVHGIELAPGNSNVAYVTSRNTPDPTNNMELVVSVADLSAPVLVGAVDGLAEGVCGVYADADKSLYYAAANPLGASLSDQMLFVANGRASDVKVIDVGAMSIVDTIPVPNEVTPDFYHGLNSGLMNWELHGVIAGEDSGFGRNNIYAVGALSGGSYNRNPDGSIDTSSTAGDPLAGTPGFRLADYRMYDVNTATKVTDRAIPLMGAGQPVNPVGYCGLEYNLNDENSNEVIASSMNAGNSTLASVLFLGTWQDTDPSAPRCYTTDPALVGTPCGVDLGPVAGRTGDVAQDGGWSFTDIATGTNTGFMSTDFDGDNESSTCGISWDATGTHAYASQMFQALVDTVNWTTRTADGQIASFPGASYHQSASDKVAGLNYVTSSAGTIDVFDMNTNLALWQIDIRALTGSSTNDVHGVELAPGNSNIMYVTSRATPDPADNMELIIDITDQANPVLKGAVNGLAEGVCGVYAIENKAAYYGTKPSLSLSATHIYWASYADYTARALSIDYSVGNSGSAGAANVAIVGSDSTMGVTAATALPASVGNIAAGGSASITMKYTVPSGLGTGASFHTTTYATAQNGAQTFTYPGPYPGA